ncbi:Cytomegalovirus UL139 protein [Hirschfeldia incana]|nr:Cytomegalovirus UL139 protein [Hirschfeldia incana]
MALSAAFKERLDQMELTRNQRLHLLQAEKELQVEKSQILATKHASIQSIERKCLMLDQKIAAQNLKITILRSTIQDLDSKYHCSVQQLRTLKSEVEELKELDQEREKYYKLKCSEMNEFMQGVDRFRSANRLQIDNLRNQVKELSSTFEEIHNKNNYLRNTN